MNVLADLPKSRLSYLAAPVDTSQLAYFSRFLNRAIARGQVSSMHPLE
jgi:hypothetical protein